MTPHPAPGASPLTPTMADLHPTADLFLGLLIWLFTTGFAELVVKPVWRRLYRRADQSLSDRLPDLK